MTRLCVPLTASTCGEMMQAIDAATAAHADMIELRLDHLADWNTDSIHSLMRKAKAFPGEVIATCRSASEGGHWDGDETTRVSLMELVGLCGADVSPASSTAATAAPPHYIDFEYEHWRASANVRQKIGLVCDVNTDSDRPRCRLILSKHDFDKTPLDLDRIFQDLLKEPCHVAKIACKAERIDDSLRMLDLLWHRRLAGADTGETPVPQISAPQCIALAMGEAGVMTRVLAKKLGAYLTFASLEQGKESAPGQVTLNQMRSLYRWDAMNTDTKVYGVVGCPVAHSMSPAIHNAAFTELSFDGVYLPFRIEPPYAAFASLVDGCLARPWLHLRGLSVTIPHKENLLRYVSERKGAIEPLARRIGVANTLVIAEDGTLSAFNTDYRGALDALMTGTGTTQDGLRDLRVSVLGAGGASRAIVAGLCDAGCRVVIHNRTFDKAASLAGEFGCEASAWESRHGAKADVIVNCTSVGMWPTVDATPLPGHAFDSHQVVFDTVYNPIETCLLRDARRAGCRTIDGVTMFVNQAAAQFEHWTRQPAPTESMRKVVQQRLSVR